MCNHCECPAPCALLRDRAHQTNPYRLL
ncbi:hypothetical protein ACGE24_04295 [Corynebacterium kroppenstedtii]